jgi:hypothetical protein
VLIEIVGIVPGLRATYNKGRRHRQAHGKKARQAICLTTQRVIADLLKADNGPDQAGTPAHNGSIRFIIMRVALIV